MAAGLAGGEVDVVPKGSAASHTEGEKQKRAQTAMERGPELQMPTRHLQGLGWQNVGEQLHLAHHTPNMFVSICHLVEARACAAATDSLMHDIGLRASVKGAVL